VTELRGGGKENKRRSHKDLENVLAEKNSMEKLEKPRVFFHVTGDVPD
jgi:hypothetical protein